MSVILRAAIRAALSNHGSIVQDAGFYQVLTLRRDADEAIEAWRTLRWRDPRFVSALREAQAGLNLERLKQHYVKALGGAAR